MPTPLRNPAGALANCIAACNICFHACLGEDDVKSLANCISLDRECAEICTMAISALYYGDGARRSIIEICIKTCEACATECEIHAQRGMQHCRDCAEACRKCIEACKAL